MPISLEVLKKYKGKNNIFIETGTYLGNTVKNAVDIGFKEIYTIELSKALFNKACLRFAKHNNVHLIMGDTIEELPKLLKIIKEPCVFWLDSHWSYGETVAGLVQYPIYLELDIISKHFIKNHTILIDDVRLMGNEWKKVSLDTVKEKLLKINKDYQINFEDGFIISNNKILKNDIIVATL